MALFTYATKLELRYWHGGKQKSTGKVPRCVERLLFRGDGCSAVTNVASRDSTTLSETTPSFNLGLAEGK